MNGYLVDVSNESPPVHLIVERTMHDRPLTQKTIGILGGCSNVATGEYYRLINEAANARLGGWDIAETIIAGMNFGNVADFVRRDDWEGLERYMAGKIEGLVRAGADLLVCVSNTLHRPLERLMAAHDVSFVHIADPTGEAMRRAGVRRAVLLGTDPVMRLDYLKDRYRDRFGVDIVVPDADERGDVDRIIFDELVKRRVLPGSRARYVEIVRRVAERERAEAVILGCTEIFLILQQGDVPEIAVFDTTRLHCLAAVELALEDSVDEPDR